MERGQAQLRDQKIRMFADHRGFLGASAGIGPGICDAKGASNRATATRSDVGPSLGPMPRQYEEILARTQQLTCLACPRSRWIVRQGFLSFAPERVLILEATDEPWHKDAGDRWTFRHGEAREKIRGPPACHGASVRNEQLGLIARLAFDLAPDYRALECWEKCAYCMAARDSLGSTGLGWNIAIPHQFQMPGRGNMGNSRVDWWLILLPRSTNC